MSKKKRPFKAPAIGKNEARELERLRAKAEDALRKGHDKEYSDIMRRRAKLQRHYENREAWRRGIRW